MPQVPVMLSYKDRHQFNNKRVKSAFKHTLLIMRPAIVGLIPIIDVKFHPITIIYFVKH